MASERSTLKGKFSAGATPAESDYTDLIDSLSHPSDIAASVATEPTASTPIMSSTSGYELSQRVGTGDLHGDAPDLTTLANSTATSFAAYDANHYDKASVDSKVAAAITTAATETANVVTPVSTQVTALASDLTDVSVSLSNLSTSTATSLSSLQAEVATLPSYATATALAASNASAITLINGKSDLAHTHDYVEESDLSAYAKLTDLAAKASAVHTHSASEITGLDSLFTTPLEVQALISANRVLLDETTILDDFYEKAEVDEQFRVKRWRTDQISLFSETVVSLAAIPAGNLRGEVNLSIAQVRVSMNANKSSVLAELSQTRADLTSEVARATAAEAAIQADVDTNEQSSASAIATEQTRAESAEVALGSRIDDVISNTDPSALDSLSEIVTQFQSNDSTLSSAITSALGTHTSELNAYISSNDASLASEVARAGAAESSLQSGVTALQTDLATTQSSIATQGTLVSTNSTDIASNATAIATTAGTVATLRTDVDSNDVDIAALQSSVGTTLPATIAAINSAIATLQTQVGVDLQATIVSIQSELTLLESKVNVTIDQKVADLQEQVNACMALITILAGTSGSGTYDDLASVSGIESATLSMTTGVTLSAPASEPLAGGFVAIPKNDTVLSGNGDYSNNVFKGSDNQNQLIAYNETLGQWEWLWVDPSTNAITIIASQPDTDDSHVPEFWSVVDPGGAFTGLPDPLEVTPAQGSTSSVVNYLEALRFFTSGYVQQGLDYAGG